MPPQVSFDEVDVMLRELKDDIATKTSADANKIQALNYLVQQKAGDAYEGLNVYITISDGKKFWHIKVNRVTIGGRKQTLKDVRDAVSATQPQLVMW